MAREHEAAAPDSEDDWLATRPVIGATLLSVGSLLVLWRIGVSLAAVPGSLTTVGWAGVAAPVVAIGCGALAMGRPDTASVAGLLGGGATLAAVSGLLVSTLPLGQPMALFAGLLSAGIGGVLCFGWSADDPSLLVADHRPALQAGGSVAVAVVVVFVALSAGPAAGDLAVQSGNDTATSTVAPTTTAAQTTSAPTTTQSGTTTQSSTTTQSGTTSAPTTTDGTTTPDSGDGNETDSGGDGSRSQNMTSREYFPVQNESLGGFVVHQGTLAAGTYDYQAHCPAPATGIGGESCLDISVDSTTTDDVGSRTARQRLGDTSVAPVDIDDFLIYKDFYDDDIGSYVHFELTADRAIADTETAPGSPSAVDVYISEFRSQNLTARLDLIQDPIFDGIPADHINYWTCTPGNDSGFGTINDVRVGLDVSPRLTDGRRVSLNAHTLGSTKTRLTDFALRVETGRHDPIDADVEPTSTAPGCA
jgi:hypothetical protein